MFQKSKRVYIKTFGCIQNTADSERVKAYFWDKGFEETPDWKESDIAVINTCIIRESAENRAYGLIDKIDKWNKSAQNGKKIKIIVTGCLAGLAHKDKSGKKLKELKNNFPEVDEFLPIENISYTIEPLRNNNETALIPISSGCNNFCSYCIVPFARGKEVSRNFEEILKEVKQSLDKGFKNILLIGQNVNSYGSDLVSNNSFKLPDGRLVKPVMVKSMGKQRIPTLFPYLLEEVANLSPIKVSFVSSNPWDFSDQLIDTIAKYPNIDRLLHLPLQAGDDMILEKMNRGYSAKDYLSLVKKIRSKIKDVRFSTDIIIGFPGETEEAFLNTVEICKKAGFEIAYLNKYSPRKGTVSAKIYENDTPQTEKKRRWNILNELINKKATTNSGN